MGVVRELAGVSVNWMQSLLKGVVVGGLAALGVWQGDIQAISPAWAWLGVLVIELVRDALKRVIPPKPTS